MINSKLAFVLGLSILFFNLILYKPEITQCVCHFPLIIPSNPVTFQKRTINLSDTSFSPVEIALLDKGPKFSPAINFKNSTETVIVDSFLAVSNLKDDLPKLLIKDVLKHRQSKSSFNSSVLKSIKLKLSENNLVLTRADKSNSFVIIKKKTRIP